ncbi:MAG: hypothetical protein Q8Q01_04470 [archaeon]|nr:hypothetical protein [archaeon]
MAYRKIISTELLLEELQRKKMLPKANERHPFLLYSLDEGLYSYHIHRTFGGLMEEAVYNGVHFRYAIQLSPSFRVPVLVIEHEKISGTERVITVNDTNINGNVFHPLRRYRRRMGGTEQILLLNQATDMFNRVIQESGLELLLGVNLKI